MKEDLSRREADLSFFTVKGGDVPVYAVTYLTCVLESEGHEFDFQSAGAGILQSMRAELPKPNEVATVLVPALPESGDKVVDPRALSMASILELPLGHRMVPCRPLHEAAYDRLVLNRVIGAISESSGGKSVVILMSPVVAADFFRKSIGPAQVCLVRTERRLAVAGATRQGYYYPPDAETRRLSEDEIFGAAEKTVLLSARDLQPAREQVDNLRTGIELAQRSIDEDTPVEIPLAAIRELMNASQGVALPSQKHDKQADEAVPFGIPLAGRILLWCVLLSLLALMLGSASRELPR